MSAILKNAFTVALCLSLGACAFKKEDSENQQRQDLAEDVTKRLLDQTEIKLNEENVHVRFDYAELGNHTLTITWPDTISSMEVFINDTARITVHSLNYYQELITTKGKISIELRAYSGISTGRRLLSQYKNIFDIAPAPIESDTEGQKTKTQTEQTSCRSEMITVLDNKSSPSETIIETEFTDSKATVTSTEDGLFSIRKSTGTSSSKAVIVDNSQKERIVRERKYTFRAINKVHKQFGKNGTVTTKKYTTSSNDCVEKACFFDENSNSFSLSRTINQIRVTTEKTNGNISYIIADELDGNPLDIFNAITTTTIDADKTVETTKLKEPQIFGADLVTKYEAVCTTTLLP